jgi:hypothetical protein
MEKEKYYGSETQEEKVIKNPKIGKANLDKYKDFLMILKDDLRKLMDKNIILNNEINETEEERQYYLRKLMNVMNFCKKSDCPETKEIMNILSHVPEDFK